VSVVIGRQLVMHLLETPRWKAHRGFTLMEAVICAGIVMLLVGLCVPAIAKSRESARMTRDLALMRQCGALLQAYCTDYKGVFPYVGNGIRSVTDWWEALGPSGAIDSQMAFDPVGVRERGQHRVYMSACLVVDPPIMMPGMVLPIDLTPTRGISDSQVVFPANKGTFICRLGKLWGKPGTGMRGTTLPKRHSHFSMGRRAQRGGRIL